MLLVFFSACNSWIDIDPADRVSGREIFSNREGFLKALNGVYVELTTDALYGKNMSVGLVDVMGQYYAIGGDTHSYYYYSSHNYTNDVVKSGFENIWQKAYAMIVNCNIIIEECGDSNPYLPSEYFGLVKGEAKALRAMLHFDLFRFFGPIWQNHDKSQKYIPYVTNTDQEISPLLTAEEFIVYVMKDLNEALELLETSDPVILLGKEGVRNEANPTGNNDFYYRQYRLNYFAVKTLLARAQLWMGQTQEAFMIAKSIIDAVQEPDNEIFPFVTNSDATNASIPDRVFSSEVMFSLYTVSRGNIYNQLFNPELEPNFLLTFAGTLTDGRVDELYDDKNDYRYRIWESYNKNGLYVLHHTKFKDYESTSSNVNKFRYMMPLIRLSEVYLIAAECSANLQEGVQYLNTLRRNRNCFDLNPGSKEELQSDIDSEFRKEVLGEGQMFFYYKRHAMQNIPNGALTTGNRNIPLESYVVPLPDSETSQRVTVSE
ncbi:MAG: RagB/SusD family nutrient uptake outer membrane protein [Odoribacter sp.]|nr:RagB/SusD family nutrient uptake outer membrane protein [Odoribacter sp.]